jgi:hypothetical protein
MFPVLVAAVDPTKISSYGESQQATGRATSHVPVVSGPAGVTVSPVHDPVPVVVQLMQLKP